jgi:phosphoglucomutase
MNQLENLSVSDEIKDKIKIWTGDEYDEETRNEINALVENNDEKELTDRFFMDLKFGTGGLRGVIGAGSNRMNKYNIWKATQGLANYIKEQESGDLSAAIACDSRNFSDEFAKEAACVLAGNNIKVYLFESLRPTPVLSYAVRHLKANTGIVITASHNPPEYNGYKVYYSDGGQIVPPHDKNIIDHVHKITALDQISHMSETEAKEKGLIQIIGKEIDEAYYEKVQELCINPEIIKQVADDIKIVYTPIHGAGNIPVRTMLERFGFKNVQVVKEQELPDGNFSTVKSPNPEEQDALNMGIELCKKIDADILLATDPDADRVGTAVKTKDGNYQLLNGNQIASILTHYILSQLKEKNRLPENGILVSTIVTTDLIKTIGKDFGIPTKDVLTGFKWIGEQMKINEELKNEGKPFKQYVFGGEESYGYLAGDFVRDKDAVISSVLFAEMTAFQKSQNKSVLDYLDEIYMKYGYFTETLKYITLKGKDGMEKISMIMDTYRKNPPEEVNGLKLLKVGDIEKDQLVNLSTGEVEASYGVPSSNVLILHLDKGIKIAMRPSGTEPKIKFYLAGHEPNVDDLEKTRKEVDERLHATIEKFLEMVQSI